MLCVGVYFPDVYFTHRVVRESGYYEERVQIVKCNKSGEGCTGVVDIYTDFTPSIAATDGYIYWIDMDDRNIKR